MRMLILLSMLLISVTVSTVNAFATPDYYYRYSIGVGYSSTTITMPSSLQNITANGTNIFVDYLFTKDYSVSLSYCFADIAQGATYTRGGVFNIMPRYYMRLIENTDGYIGLGYTTLNVDAGATTEIAGSGFVYEVGLEMRMPNYIIENMTSSVFYRNSALTLMQGNINLSATGSTYGINLNYLF